MPTYLSRTEWYDIYQALGDARPFLAEGMAVFTIATIRQRLKGLVESMDEMKKAPEKVTEYQTERTKLCADHAEKEPGGEPKMVPIGPNQVKYLIDPKKSAEFQTALNEMNEKFKPDVDAWNKALKDINDATGKPYEEIELEKFPKLRLSWFKSMPKEIDADILLPIIINDLPELQELLGETPVVKAKKNDKPAAKAK